MLLLRTSRGVDPGIPLLRSLGSNAHVWLPGANGVSVASLPSNNYLLSDGSTGYSTVDGVDGLTLDGMGALGSELLAVQDLTTWSVTAGTPTINNATTVTYVGDGQITKAISTVAGRAYWLTIAGSKTGGNIVVYSNSNQHSTGIIVNGTFGTYYFVARATGFIGIRSVAAQTVTVTSISVKEYTGTHLTQATSANKPLVRRGMLNELLNSATPATQSVTCIAAPYTLALYGTGNVVLSGTGAGTLTGTGASDLVVLNFTPTAGSVTFTKAGTVSSFGLFKGTFTAAQILAEGGIPTTTATAASNPSAGKYWWSFDGSNDSLLSGNLGITNACTIVVAGRVNSLAATQMLFAETTNGVQVSIATDGSVSFAKVGDAALVATAAGVVVAGVPFVLTARLSAGTADIRKNGAQSATAASATVFAAVTGARIGTAFDGTTQPAGGAIGWVVPLPAALSDADCLTVEQLAAAQFPGLTTPDGDANAMLLEDSSGFLTMETGDLLLLE